MTIGELLRLARELKNLTLREVESKTGMSNAMISQYENGRSQPSFRNAAILCDVYNLDLKRLAAIVRESK